LSSDQKTTTFDKLKDGVIEKIQSHFPVTLSKRTLVLKDVWAEDDLSEHDVASQLKAKDNDQTWGVPIKGRLELLDTQTGKVIDTKEMTLAKLPKMTSRYSYIVDGSEYQVDHLFRLKSGAYTRIDRKGDVKSEFNLRQGQNFDITLDRVSKKINFVPKGKSAKVPVYPLMKVLGVSDDDMEKAWGPEVFKANKVIRPEHTEGALSKFFERMKPLDWKGPSPTGEKLAESVYHWFDQTALYPDTTKITLGQPFEKVNGGALLASTNKLLGVSRRTVEPDDRDSLVFKEVWHVEDFIPEKLDRQAKRIKGRIRQTLNHKDNIRDILKGGELFSEPIKDFFTVGGNVSERGEQTNPLQMLGGQFKTTIVAPDYGGVKKPERIGEEAQSINPSHFGFLDPMHTPESERTGITLHLGSAVRKVGRELQVQVHDMQTGKQVPLNTVDFHHATIVLPDQVKWDGKKPIPFASDVKVKLPGGDIGKMPFSEARYVLPSAKGMFDFASNLIPFLPCDQGNRTSMADKQMEQAISLTHREQPLVQSSIHHKTPEQTYEKIVGRFSSTVSLVDGKVVAVKDGAVHVSDGKNTHIHQIYDHFPTNEPLGMMHSTPIVKVGDKVAKGQTIADSNFTKDGRLALGTNLRVGYLPYKGYNFEDGVVISETASKKLTSEHLHKLRVDLDPSADNRSPKEWRANASQLAQKVSDLHFASLDADGVIKPGTKVQPGQILTVALAPNLDGNDNAMRKAFGNKGVRAWKDKSLIWDEDREGIVTRVVKSPSGKTVKVFVKTVEPMVVGDKVTGRHGNKGIVTNILKDEEMPFTKDPKTGEKVPLEVILNPSGVPTRMNIGQVLETAAAKIAQKTGKPYFVDNFSGPNHDYRQQVMDDLKKHGLHDEEMVFDPEDQRRALGSILVGPQYLMKLKHQVEKKLSVRGGGFDVAGRPYGYDSEFQPKQGGSSGGQGISSLETYSLLSHGARHNLREMATYKSDMQKDGFWEAIQRGEEPPTPTIPFSYKKFEALINGLGVDIKKEGTTLKLMPMTDKDVLKRAGKGKNEITEASLVLGKNLREEKGGFFDRVATGGHGGDKWSFVRLAEPMPNPIFVGDKQSKGPIPSLLGLGVEDVDAIMAGKKELNGMVGGKAIQSALKKLDVDYEIAACKAAIPGKKEAALDRLNKKLKHLLALKEADLKPHEAYVLNYLPVVPPFVRPITASGKGNDIVKMSLNDIYKTFAGLNNELRSHDPKFGATLGHELRGSMWNTFKALQSVGNYKPIYDEDSHSKRKLKGIIEYVGHGDDEQNKDGYFQSRLIKRRQDLSIRSVIIPEPSLGIDQVGLPEHAAMELYKPFVVAHLGRTASMIPLKAIKEIQDNTALAKKSLDAVMAERPLLLKRDPALHKFSVMAFTPKRVPGKAIRIHPLVCGGFNADFDGDTMAGTVPISHEAVEEAKKMLPSNNLFSPTSYRGMYVPSQEAMLGLHLMSKWDASKPVHVDSVAALDKLVDEGKISHNAPVIVKGFSAKPTTFGRLRIESKLPRNFAMREQVLHAPDFSIDKSMMPKMVEMIARDHQPDFDRSINQLKNLGNEHSFKTGFSLGLKDFAPLPQRDAILAAAHKKVEHLKATISDKKKQDAAVIDVYNNATEELDKASKLHTKTRLGTMVFSGARGKTEQLRQMISAPMLMAGPAGRVVTTPVTRSYSEGLDIGDYWLSQHGARKGTLQRSAGTRDPGSMTKDIINSTMSTLIVSDDCGTKHGVSMPLNHSDIHDRYTAADYKLKDGTHIGAGAQLTPSLVDKLKHALGREDREIQVRSPLKCQHGEGLCAKCYGLNENGKLHALGTNIGTIAGQALGEPATQLAMDAFHSGGLAAGRGGASVSRIQRLRDLLTMPKNLKNSATLSEVNGHVTAIHQNTAIGGYDIRVDGHTHPAILEHNPDLKVGAKVSRGDSLSASHAPINPIQLLDYTKNLDKVQGYLTSELYQGLYKKEGVRQRNIETVVRALTNLTEVKDPGTSHWIAGDVVPHSVVEEHNRGVRGNPAERPVHHESVLYGSQETPQTGNDWMARLNYRKLKSTLLHGAAEGWKSDIHGTHPIPGIARGSEFGRPPKGKKPFAY
jgi:DNA-directed RNA polymerase subunit beta'